MNIRNWKKLLVAICVVNREKENIKLMSKSTFKSYMMYNIHEKKNKILQHLVNKGLYSEYRFCINITGAPVAGWKTFMVCDEITIDNYSFHFNVRTIQLSKAPPRSENNKWRNPKMTMDFLQAMAHLEKYILVNKLY